MSWIAIDDLLSIVQFVLEQKIAGPLNVVSPNPVTNHDFTKTLGKVLSRPTFLPMPAFAARLAFGEMADALLLSSSRVMPDMLTKSGYAFRFPDLHKALEHLINKNSLN
jgi:NAD dependent epimerase/dehydratase family enzyme